MKTDTFVLTRLQREMLMHRLTAGDALVQALTDTHPDDPPSPFTESQVEAAVNSVSARVASGDWSGMSDCEREVLADCVNGSVWIGCMITEEPDALIARHQKTIDALAEKVQELTGIECNAPWC